MGGELEVYEVEASPPAPRGLFQTDDPEEIVRNATKVAEALARVVKERKLSVMISGREYCRVEGYTLLGTMLGVFPNVVWSRRLEGDDPGWEARVEAQTLDGRLVGSGEAQCTRSERAWAKRDDYALRSQAQTRATSKALRVPLGFVMSLAGYAATPAEEMPREKPPAPPNSGSFQVPDEVLRTREENVLLAQEAQEAVKRWTAEADKDNVPLPDGDAASWSIWVAEHAKLKFGVVSRGELKPHEWLQLANDVEQAVRRARGRAGKSNGARARAFAIVNKLDNDKIGPVPDECENWNVWMSLYAREKYGVDSRAELTVEQWRELADHVAETEAAVRAG